MSDTVTTARRWNSFVCPGCRFVFRVAQDHDGLGVVCPACRIMLRLPGPDDETAPLVLPPQEAVAEIVEEVEDEDEAMEAVSATRSDRNFVALLALSALALLVAFWWWMKPDPMKPASAPLAGPDSGASHHKPGVEMEPTAKGLILEVEQLVKAFLEAPTPAEAIQWVREPEKSLAKIEAGLSGKPYAAPGFQGIVDDSIATMGADSSVMSVQVRTGDFELREIALVKVGGTYKVDWDSWAGWSEMTWEAFQREKPVEPKLFRVVLSRVDYYNFAFKDDREWTSYRIDSPDGLNSLFGYVPRTGEVDQQIRPVDASQKVKLLLRLKFPPQAPANNQVLIESAIGEGWVIP